MKIRKAIIPVAGLGTRFLPATKAQPKEMLALVDKPVIQYIVEEAVNSGIEEIIFVTSGTKRAIEDHFDRNFELEYRLKEKGKEAELKEILKISDLARFVYVRQKTPLGDGHALLTAKDLIGDEPCAVLFGDDVIDGAVPTIKQLIEVYEKTNSPVMAVMEVPKADLRKYGVAKTVDGNTTSRIEALVEKPDPSKAPSNLAVVGRYIITPKVFDELTKIKPAADGEIRLIDALSAMLEKGEAIYAHKFSGTRYDCGNKTQFLLASINFGLKHQIIGPEFKEKIQFLIHDS